MQSTIVNLRNRLSPIVEQTTFVTGSEDYLQSSESLIGVGGQWTCAVWLRRSVSGGANTWIFQVCSSDIVTNRILFVSNGTNSVQTDLRGPTGSSMVAFVKSFSFLDLTSGGSSAPWEHFAFTYDDNGGGSDIHEVYYNGVDFTDKTTPGTGIGDPYISKLADGNPSMTDTSRNITLGAATDGFSGPDWSGRMYNWGLWDVVLSDAEIAAIYNEGNGARFDLLKDKGDYASSADLQHFYRFDDASDRGKDLGNASTLKDINAEEDTGFSFVTDDFPGV